MVCIGGCSTSLRASDPVKERDQKRGGILKAERKLKQLLGTLCVRVHTHAHKHAFTSL
jgi:hypothetical protein